MSEKSIYIKNAKENNLKGIDVEIPRDKLVVFTGISGSGKAVWLSIRYLPKDKEGIWKVCRHMRGNF